MLSAAPGRADRVRGVLLGLAAGDRNGGPIRMACELAASLEGLGRFDPEDIGARYLVWWRREGFDTGPVAAGVFDLVAFAGPANYCPILVGSIGGAR
jgi:hypothetical protein